MQALLYNGCKTVVVMWLQLFSGAQTRPAFVLVLLLRTDGIDTGIDVNLDNVFPLHFGAVYIFNTSCTFTYHEQ